VYHLEGLCVPLVVRVPQFGNHCPTWKTYTIMSFSNISFIQNNIMWVLAFCNYVYFMYINFWNIHTMVVPHYGLWVIVLYLHDLWFFCICLYDFLNITLIFSQFFTELQIGKCLIPSNMALLCLFLSCDHHIFVMKVHSIISVSLVFLLCLIN